MDDAERHAAAAEIALEVVRDFLEGMPEIGVLDDRTKRIVHDFFDGNAHAYILNSFEQFLDQTILS